VSDSQSVDAVIAAEGGATPVEKEFGKTGMTVFIEDIAFNTWQSFVFYAYFEKVSFAPLRSQPNVMPKGKADWLANMPQPPQCSPKSMYRLADKYDLKGLRELAKKDIKSKLSEDNILDELFSDFTSRYSEILELEIQHVKENDGIRAKIMEALPLWLAKVSAGELPNSADVLLSLFRSLSTATQPQTVEPKCPSRCNVSFTVTRTCSNYNCRRTF